MLLTSGKFVATMHRVNTLNIDKDRYASFPFELYIFRDPEQVYHSLCSLYEA